MAIIHSAKVRGLRLARPIATALVCLYWAQAWILSAADLSLGSGTVGPAGSALLPVSLQSATPVVALQFDVIYDESSLVPSQPAEGTTLAGHFILSSQPGSGLRRVLVYSLANTPLANGVLLHLPVTALPEAAGAFSLTLTNAIFSDATGLAVLPLILHSGTLTVLTEAPPRLADVERSGDGAVRFRLIGSEGRRYQIQISSDLENWNLLTILAVNGGSVPVTDATAGFSHRFYRAVQE